MGPDRVPAGPDLVVPHTADSVSLTWYWRFNSSADCEVPEVNVPLVEMGTWN